MNIKQEENQVYKIMLTVDESICPSIIILYINIIYFCSLNMESFVVYTEQIILLYTIARCCRRSF